ncbi:hypothetical protein ACFQS1_00435 [Paractinoplanes rhizophilus]|uniref:Uncharacterized protein n=1 Tax=Paractinoplanes rhizophilus TaxID=1416877 RepID=A0ABW2HIK3_9ACTN
MRRQQAADDFEDPLGLLAGVAGRDNFPVVVDTHLARQQQQGAARQVEPGDVGEPVGERRGDSFRIVEGEFHAGHAKLP